jgi:hypothetical protein
MSKRERNNVSYSVIEGGTKVSMTRHHETAKTFCAKIRVYIPDTGSWLDFGLNELIHGNRRPHDTDKFGNEAQYSCHRID